MIKSVHHQRLVGWWIYHFQTEGNLTVESMWNGASLNKMTANKSELDLSSICIDAPIIASHNDYLLEQSNSIRQRTIPWEGF